MVSPSYNQWQDALDIDDSDLIPTPAVCSTINPVIIHEVATNTQTLFDDENIKELDVDDSDLRLTDIVQTQILSKQNEVDTCIVEPTRITPGPAGNVQTNIISQMNAVEKSIVKTFRIIPGPAGIVQTQLLSQTNEVDNCVVASTRIIPGPAGIVQTAKRRKLADIRHGGEEAVMSTHEYIRKVIEDVEEDDDFILLPWLNLNDYVRDNGGIVTGCFRDVKKFIKNGKLEKVAAVIKSCSPNALGDLTVTLKDLSGTISGTVHHKVIADKQVAQAITVGSALILHNVSVFSPKQSSNHYLNITKKNIVKLFHKDGWSVGIV